MGFYTGYRAGRADAEREQRKAEYIHARFHAEKDFRAETGRDWNRDERIQFDRDWRMVHLDLPTNPLSEAHNLLGFVLCVILLIISIPSILASDNNPPRFILAAIISLYLVCANLLSLYRYLQACKMIEQKGEKTWREQEILRQEEKRFDPWEVNERTPWM